MILTSLPGAIRYWRRFVTRLLSRAPYLVALRDPSTGYRWLLLDLSATPSSVAIYHMGARPMLICRLRRPMAIALAWSLMRAWIRTDTSVDLCARCRTRRPDRPILQIGRRRIVVVAQLPLCSVSCPE